MLGHTFKRESIQSRVVCGLRKFIIITPTSEIKSVFFFVIVTSFVKRTSSLNNLWPWLRSIHPPIWLICTNFCLENFNCFPDLVFVVSKSHSSGEFVESKSALLFSQRISISLFNCKFLSKIVSLWEKKINGSVSKNVQYS